MHVYIVGSLFKGNIHQKKTRTQLENYQFSINNYSADYREKISHIKA